MLTAIRKVYFRPSVHKNIAKYLNKYFECQQVKAEHRHPSGLLLPIIVPEWKWEVISVDFIIGLPRSKNHNYSIMVVVDKLSKSTHFIPMQYTYKTVQIADIFMREIFSRDVKFTSAFWKNLFIGLHTQINFSTAYHP